MSVHVLSWVLRHSEAKHGQRLVLIALAEFAHDDGDHAFPSIETLMERARLGRTAVKESLRKLREAGRIEQTGVSPWGTPTYRVVMGGPESDRGGSESDRIGSESDADRVGIRPQPVKEPSSNPSEENARASVDSLPDDFPEELKPHARRVWKVLHDVAAQHNAKEVRPLALGRTMMARPRKPFVQSAYDFAAWAADPPRPIVDVVASYRTWIDRAPDLANTERMPEDAPPSGVRGGKTSARDGREAARKERNARDRAAIQRIVEGGER